MSFIKKSLLKVIYNELSCKLRIYQRSQAKLFKKFFPSLYMCFSFTEMYEATDLLETTKIYQVLLGMYYCFSFSSWLNIQQSIKKTTRNYFNPLYTERLVVVCTSPGEKKNLSEAATTMT